MIKYSLRCEQNHGFESWFKNSGTFERLLESNSISCPHCHSLRISKAVQTPKLSKGLGKKGPISTASTRQLSAEKTAMAAHVPATNGHARELIKKLHRHVRENFEYVGQHFAEEARKIHYGEEEDRPLWGEVSREEARDLRDEGIPAQPIPELPKSDA